MGVHVLAVYRPLPGHEAELRTEVADHVPLLRRLGLATDRPAVVLAAPDGTLVEHFEWVSHQAIEHAHSNPDVLAMWGRFEGCCTYGTLSGLPNASVMFAEFELVGSY